MQNQSERLDDLDMLENARQALGMCQVDHPDRPKVLDDLAFACQTRLETVGDLESLAEVVVLRRQALDLRPPGHPDRFVSLNNLANALQAQFQQLGDSDVLAEALDLHRQALNLRPPGHPDRFASLNNLANALQARFQQLGDSDSLAEALDLHRQALNLRPPGHHDRFVSLNNLANALPARFQQLGDTDSLAEALDLHRQALDLRPAGHRDRSASLNNLANALHTQFERLGDSDSLDEALDLHRQALELRPYPHPDRPSSLTNLGIALEARFAKQSLAPDLDEALEIAREGLRSCAPGHPMRVRFLFMIAKCLLQPGSRVFDFENGIHHISEGLRNRSSPASQTLRHTIHILPTVEAAMQFSAESASGVNMSQLDRHDVVLQVYVLVLELLPRAASFGLDHIGRLNALSGAETISRDAAALAVLAGRTTEAVELLEEGRGVFWLQAFRLRSADLDLVPDQDAQELRRLSKALEAGGTHDCSMSAAQRERHVEERRRLSAAAESLLEDIRTRPAMSRFLLPPAFDLLVQSLPETGFVVMLVASALGHYALVLNRAAAEVKHVTLATPPGGGFSRTFRAALPRDGGQEPASPEDIDIAHSMSRDLCEEMLAQLWTLVVKPVVGLLKLKKASGRYRPRIWWCASGDFSFLPIHAATGVAQDGVTEFASDYFVASYIPTLSALTKSRASWHSVPLRQLTSLLAACKSSPHHSPLDNVEREIDATRTCFEQASVNLLLSSSPNTSGQVLRDALTAQNPHILHLACRGEQAKNPLDSAFLLSDGRFSIQSLMKIHLPDAVLAFLSASQTARGSEAQPDQAVHLAASMLFCGFRSVVGTMWSMNDEDGPAIARWFYEGLFAKEEMDLDDIAYALDGAVTKLRKKGAPASQWALFIHIGG